jgi:hypothetical protein
MNELIHGRTDVPSSTPRYTPLNPIKITQDVPLTFAFVNKAKKQCFVNVLRTKNVLKPSHFKLFYEIPMKKD